MVLEEKVKKMLKLQEFIQANKNDWEEMIAKEPYFIKVSHESFAGHRLIGFKYNQIDSDFNQELVRECRGIILDEDSLEPISVPFFKFGNYGESYCPTIDWDSAKVTEKIDGSLVKIVRMGDELLISTNGCIDASKASITQTFACKYGSYRDLILAAEPIKDLSNDELLSLFKEGYTYMFELTSPYNKVVIPYEGIRLSFIGVRDNKSLQESLIYDHPLSKVFNTPKQYSFKSLDDCIANAKLLPYNEEGYVVVDKYFNRVKVKSAAYVAIHHLRGEGVLTPRKALEIVRQNEVVEFLSYFEEYRANFEKLGQSYEALIDTVQKDWDEHYESIVNLDSRRDKAMFILQHCAYPHFAFAMLDGKKANSREWVAEINPDTILEMMEKIKG